MSQTSSSFDTVLVANRGEIALRIFRTARALGYRTVAVYSEADRGALHVRAADRAMFLGGSAPRESYLSIEKILAAAKEASGGRVGGTASVAIHPGYGFLSENADFARAVTEGGFAFVGPDAASIAAMGNKSAAKVRMIEAGVPCVPGYLGDDQSEERMVVEARSVGFPLMVKAAAGGGGRGMRLVHEESALAGSLRAARSEAESAFGSGQLLLERAVTGARHVEVQVFGDRHGQVVHFGERDCSIQRRNQKVVEESPSPAVNAELRRAMGEAAVKAARAVRYVGAGTVEFLLGEDGQFYFLEMNTRLQVEHAVTERVHDVDLVELQLRIAAGLALPWSQDEIAARRHGHAIEVRLCAEDPADGYRPQTGTVVRYHPPDDGADVRIDAALEDGTVVSPYYDSMLGKIIAHGADREDARRRVIAALSSLSVLGVTTNRDFLRAVLETERFASGRFSTSFLGEEPVASRKPAAELVLRRAALAGLARWSADAEELRAAHGIPGELSGWSSTELTASPLILEAGASGAGERITVRVRAHEPARGAFVVTANRRGETVSLALRASLEAGDRLAYEEAGNARVLRFAREGDRFWVDAEGSLDAYLDVTYAPPAREDVTDGTVRATGAGRIVRVQAQVGDPVKRGQTLVVVESMKMELELASAIDGVVTEMHARVGEQVAAQRVLAVVTSVTPPSSAAS